MKTLTTILIFTAISIATFAQSSGSANATVTANLKKGLSVSQVGGNLTYGEIILNGSAQTPSITSENGAIFRILGHPNKNTTITFSTATLNNNAWVTTNGGSNGTITFTPSMMHTGASSTYTGATAVTSGTAYPLVNVTGDGNLYLWVGGTLGIGGSQAHGDYTGTFTVSVAY